MITTEIITAKDNSRIKYAVKLRDKESFRREEGLFIAEGARLCYDAALSGVEVKELFVTEKALSKYDEYIRLVEEKAERSFVVSEAVAQKMSDTKTSQGVFCILKMLDKNTIIGKIKYNGKFIALENVSNPSNLGAVVRTAEAMGLDGIIISGGCDIYNPKSQRASMGSLFRLPVIEVESLSQFFETLKNKGMKIYAGVPDCNALKITEADMSGGVVCVVGNEGNGITEETVLSATAPVTIPMKGRAESLNAAAAASIIIWEMMR